MSVEQARGWRRPARRPPGSFWLGAFRIELGEDLFGPPTDSWCRRQSLPPRIPRVCVRSAIISGRALTGGKGSISAYCSATTTAFLLRVVRGRCSLAGLPLFVNYAHCSEAINTGSQAAGSAPRPRPALTGSSRPRGKATPGRLRRTRLPGLGQPNRHNQGGNFFDSGCQTRRQREAGIRFVSRGHCRSSSDGPCAWTEPKRATRPDTTQDTPFYLHAASRPAGTGRKVQPGHWPCTFSSLAPTTVRSAVSPGGGAPAVLALSSKSQ